MWGRDRVGCPPAETQGGRPALLQPEPFAVPGSGPGRLVDVLLLPLSGLFAALRSLDRLSPPRAAVREFFSGVGALCESCTVEAEAMYAGGR